MGCGWRSQYLAIVLPCLLFGPLVFMYVFFIASHPRSFHAAMSLSLPCLPLHLCVLLSPYSLVPLVPLVPRPSVHSYPSPFSPCPSVHSSPSPLPPLSPCRPGFSLSCCPPLSPLSPCSPCVPCPSPSPCPLVPLVSLSPWSSSHLVPLSPCSLDNLFLFIPLFSLFSLGALCSALLVLLVFFVIPVDFMPLCIPCPRVHITCVISNCIITYIRTQKARQREQDMHDYEAHWTFNI